MVSFAILMWVRHYVSLRVAIGSVALSVLWPPWLAAGFGAVVLLVATCLTRRKQLSSGVLVS
jgi:hypothetical protein